MSDEITIDGFEFADNVIQYEDYPPCHIVNVVCTFNLGCSVNLKLMSLHYGPILPGKFNIKGFAAMIINGKYDKEYFTALIFATSNVVFTGAKTEDRARTGAWALVAYLNKSLGIPATVSGFAIRNIVSNFSLGEKVELNELCKALGGMAHLKPELIHCCRVRNQENPNHVLLVYVTGNMVLTGAKTREEVMKIYTSGVPICRAFRGGKTLTRHALRYRPKKRQIGETELQEINKKLQEWEVSAIKNKKQKTNKKEWNKENDNPLEKELEGVLENEDVSADLPYVNYLNPLSCKIDFMDAVKFSP